MALFHIRTKVIQRTKGKRVISAAAYRRATKLFDASTQQYFDYSSKQGVIHSELLVPENSPAWINALVELHKTDPNSAAELLWNKVEEVEKRVDAQLARDIEFALPVELDQKQCLTLAREFVHEVFVRQGMVADFSIHWDEGNPHVHVLLTTRELTPDGFGKKMRAWNDRGLIQHACFKLAELTNYHLYQHGHDVRIDHRSYAERGIDLIPSTHQGKAVTDMDRRGIYTEVKANADRIRELNLQKIASNPEVLLQKMQNEQSAFTEQKIVQELGRYITDKNSFLACESEDHNENKKHAAKHASEILKKLDKEDERNAKTVLSPQVILEILKKIEHHESVFSERDLAKILSSYTNNAETFARALIELKSHQGLIYLGVGEDGRDRYTTRYMFDLENKTQQLASNLTQTKHINVGKRCLDSYLSQYQKLTSKTLTAEQKDALRHLISSNKLSCLVGRAGTGKSFILGAARHIWEAKGVNVHGIALSGIAATNLDQSAGIDSRTIESFLYAYEQQKLTIKKNDVIIMDEAGMTDVESMHKVLKVATDCKAKLVLVGDPQQLQSVGPGAIFRAILQQAGFAEIQQIYRQEEEWQRTATSQLAAGNIKDAVSAYDINHCIHFAENEDSAYNKLVNDWHEARAGKQIKPECLVLAHRNEDVLTLNQLIRASRIRQGEISEGFNVKTANGSINVAKDDRILFTKNDRKIGVSNGQFATITDVQFTESGKVINFTAKLDGSLEEVIIDPKAYKNFDYGYAATIHKSQGVTTDHSFVYLGGFGWNKHLAYVAMSRHRKTCHLYASHTIHKNIESVTKSLNRYGLKDCLIDFPLGFGARRGISPTESQLKNLIVHLAIRLKQMAQNLKDNYEQTFFAERYWSNKETEAIKQQELEETWQRREDAKIVAQYVDANKDYAVAWKEFSTFKEKHGFSLNPAKEFQEVLHQTPEFRDCLNKVAIRDKLAHTINKELGRYTRALEIYQINHTSILKQAEIHINRTRVQQYNEFDNQQKVVLRDKIAFTIINDIKSHYSTIKEMNINMKALNQHARDHERRTLLKTLSGKERLSFKIVEDYRLYVQKAGKLNKEFMDAYTKKQSLPHNKLDKLQALVVKRDELAHKIMQNFDLYGKALNFYQIGISQNKINPNYEATQQYAQQRWYKLQEQAARYVVSERISEYRKAIFVNDTSLRQKLAFEITQNEIQIKAHHVAILSQSTSPSSPFLPSDLWRVIREDAKAYQCSVYLEQLNKQQKKDFNLVEAYVKERRATAKAWHEIFTAKENQALSDEIIYQKLQPFVKASQYERDKLSALILKEPGRFEQHLKFFDIELNSLIKSAQAHEYRERIASYLAAPTRLEKAALAERILEQPKEHFSAIKENNISWKALYCDADIITDQRLFNQLTPAEKCLQRLFKKYQKMNRKSGHVWSQVFKAKEAGKEPTINIQTKASIISSKRDALAAKLVDLEETHQFNLLFENGGKAIEKSILHSNKNYQPEKVKQQAQKHLERKTIIDEWKTAKNESFAILKSFINSSKNKQQNLGAYLDWMSNQSEIDEIAKTIKQRPALYHAALLEANESYKTFKGFEEHTSILKNKMQQFIEINKEHEKQKEYRIQLTEEQLAKLNKVNSIIKQTRPVAGTIAEIYLRKHRGIIGKLPASLRYHPGYYNSELGKRLPALISIAKNANKQIQSLQMTFLDARTCKKVAINNSKITYGMRNGSSVLINQGQNNKMIAIAEGVETALSIKEANPNWTIYATLGVSNYAHIPLSKETTKVIFCADNDGKNKPSLKQMENAAETLAKKGIDVWMVMPDEVKSDFNDLLIKKGIDHVKRKLTQIQHYKSGISIDRVSKDITSSAIKLTGSKTNDYASPHPANKTDFTNYWKEIIAESKPISGTLAEKYFEKLSINNIECKSLGFHDNVWDKVTKSYLPALIAKAHGLNEAGKPVEKGIQVTFLDNLTANKAPLKAPVRYAGESKGTVVMIQKPLKKDDTWYLAMDVESALSIAKAKPDVRVAYLPAFSELEKLPLKGHGNTMILCTRKNISNTVINDVAKVLQAKNFDVRIAVPQAKDFAETYQQYGIKVIQDCIDNAKPFEKERDQEIDLIIQKFDKLDKELVEASKKKHSAYANVAQQNIDSYALSLAKNNKLLEEIKKAAPDILKRINNALQAEKEDVIER